MAELQAGRTVDEETSLLTSNRDDVPGASINHCRESDQELGHSEDSRGGGNSKSKHHIRQTQVNRCSGCLVINKRICRFLALLFTGVGVVTQLLTCFSRQNPYAHWTMQDQSDSNESNLNISYCKMVCDIRDKNFVTGFLFPDAVVVLLSLWVYFTKPTYNWIICTQIGIRICTWIFSWICGCNITSLDQSLNTLIEESEGKIYQTRIKRYIAYSIGYIICSLALSAIDIHYFGFGTNHFIIQSALFPNLISSNDTFKIPAIIFSLLGFIAFDFLYIYVIWTYTYRCDLLIDYLKSIEYKFPKNQTNWPWSTAGFTSGFTGGQQKKLKDASKFLRELNDNALATGTVIVIAGFTAFSCAINLTSTTDCPHIKKYGQVMVVTLRLVLWLCIVLFPFY